MKLVLGLLFVGAVSAPAWPAQAQNLPPGPYLRQCRDIRMEGQFLHAWCQGSHGSGRSSINVLSCSTAISVDAEGGLICGGPGSPQQPYPGQPYPTQPYPPPGAGPWPPGAGQRPPPGYANRWSARIYDRYGWRGRSMQLRGDMPNLHRTGLNDRVASIRLGRRTGPWLVCSDANYRGRCVTVSSDVANTAQLGMLNSISSMRPLRWDEAPWPR